MIDKEYPIDRVKGLSRVAVLGDSFAAGEEVLMGQRFHELWEKWILEKTGQNTEFLNFGVRSFGTWNELQIFHLKSAKYKPDLTILNVFWGNDIEDNIRQLNTGAYNPLKEEYPDPSPWDKILGARKNFNKWLWNNVISYQFFRKYYVKLEHKIKAIFQPGLKSHLERIKNTDKNKSKSKKSDRSNLETDSEGEYDDKFFDNSDGFKLIRKLILKLKQEVEDVGGKLAVIHFPSAMQVHGYPNMPLDSFDDFLKKNNIPHLNLFPKYAALERDDLIKTTLKKEHNDYHFSSYGHEVYAKFTKNFIDSLLVQKKSQ
ncbi:MAG: SGNH/GDSL hydrolase family protein [Nitrospinales bacterium]